MAKAFVIELDGVTAGLVIPERGGFRFRCSDTRFRSLDDQKFDGIRPIYRRIQRLLIRMEGGAHHAEAPAS